MGSYAVTGSASGMGQEVVRRIVDSGHTAITVDIADADIVADLSTTAGRRTAAAAVLEACGGALDGAVMAAGIGPTPGKDTCRLIGEINYLGVVELLEAWRPALAATDRAKVVAFASNSTTIVPAVPKRAVNALLAGDVDRMVKAVGLFGKHAPPLAYAASKIALSRWVRRNAVTPEWAGAGIRLNAIAPGAILTPLLEKQLANPAEARQIKSLPVPVGGYGDPRHLADWVHLMLSDSADFLCGSVVFVDGGSDAWYRADDWPRPVPVYKIKGYLGRMKEFKQTFSRR